MRVLMMTQSEGERSARKASPPRIGEGDGESVVVEPPPEVAVLDEELDRERGGEDLMQRADQEFVLADRETLHN
jgi:hypothetical protein